MRGCETTALGWVTGGRPWGVSRALWMGRMESVIAVTTAAASREVCPAEGMGFDR